MHSIHANGSAWLVLAFWAGVIAFLLLRLLKGHGK